MAVFYAFTNDAEKDTWLDQHVPHRVCAALALLPMKGKWAMPTSPTLPNRDFHVWCIGRCVDEGRKAAMRWLIEFVGVRLDRNGKPAAVKPYDNDKTVTIAQLGGSMFDTTRPDALKLAKVWQACSQASLHPTEDTGVDVRPDDLAGALQIVIAHLEDALYKPLGRQLRDIVLHQEDLTIRREAKKQA